jgi:hypothetical protein
MASQSTYSNWKKLVKTQYNQVTTFNIFRVYSFVAVYNNMTTTIVGIMHNHRVAWQNWLLVHHPYSRSVENEENRPDTSTETWLLIIWEICLRLLAFLNKRTYRITTPQRFIISFCLLCGVGFPATLCFYFFAALLICIWCQTAAYINMIRSDHCLPYPWNDKYVWCY